MNILTFSNFTVGGTLVTLQLFCNVNAVLTIELTACRFNSKKLFNCFERLGCFNFLKALASICPILSLVTENCKPPLQEYDRYSYQHQISFLNSSPGVKVDKIFVVASPKLDFMPVLMVLKLLCPQ